MRLDRIANALTYAGITHAYAPTVRTIAVPGLGRITETERGLEVDGVQYTLEELLDLILSPEAAKVHDDMCR